jgi:hypothetical protein
VINFRSMLRIEPDHGQIPPLAARADAPPIAYGRWLKEKGVTYGATVRPQ